MGSVTDITRAKHSYANADPFRRKPIKEAAPGAALAAARPSPLPPARCRSQLKG